MSSKLENDKYYTPDDVVSRCLNELKNTLLADKVNPSRVIEPSAGNGAFSSKIKNCIAYDIEPEADGVIKQDFLELDLGYIKGTVVIGNPPFGHKGILAKRFYDKCTDIADYIGFILPINHLNNKHDSYYKFDLVKSIDLGDQVYTDRRIHCCFNIYKRPKTGNINKKKYNKLLSVSFYRQDCKDYDDKPYDIKMCHWGNTSAGKIYVSDTKVYSGEYKIKINDNNLKELIIKTLDGVDWKKRIGSASMLSIKVYHIINLLKEKIPNIY